MIQNILLAILFGGVFTLCFGGVGVFLISRLRAAKREAAESLNWPSTPGRIIISDISMYQPSREVDSSRSPTYAPVIEYTYIVQGIEYHGKRIGFTGGGVTSGTRGDAARLIKPYPVNASIPVYFNPNNPAEAVLEHKVQSQGGLLVVTIVFLLLGVTACGISIYAILGELSKAY
jgi:hypothetical protein